MRPLYKVVVVKLGRKVIALMPGRHVPGYLRLAKAQGYCVSCPPVKILPKGTEVKFLYGSIALIRVDEAYIASNNPLSGVILNNEYVEYPPARKFDWSIPTPRILANSMAGVFEDMPDTGGILKRLSPAYASEPYAGKFPDVPPLVYKGECEVDGSPDEKIILSIDKTWRRGFVLPVHQPPQYELSLPVEYDKDVMELVDALRYVARLWRKKGYTVGQIESEKELHGLDAIAAILTLRGNSIDLLAAYQITATRRTIQRLRDRW